MKHTEEATTFGYSRDTEKWVVGYEGREIALLQGIDDVSGDTSLPFDIYTAECRCVPLRYDVTEPDLLAAARAEDPAAFLVDTFKARNNQADIGGSLFEGVHADDDLRAAIAAADSSEQASEAVLEWLEHRVWLADTRAIEVKDVRRHEVAASSEGAA